MRAFTVAAVQLAPVPGPLTAASVAANLERCVAAVESCVAGSGAELVVLPESATTGFTPGVGPEELFDLVSGVPGPGHGTGAGGGPQARGARRPGHVQPGGAAAGRLELRRPDRAGRVGAGDLREDPPVLRGVVRGRWLGHPRRRGVRGRDRPRPDRHDHLLRRGLPGAVPDPGRAGRRGDRAAVGTAALGRPVGADQPGQGVRQPRLRDRGQRHRHRPGRRPVLRQLDDRDADRRGGRPRGVARVLGLGPARPASGRWRRSPPGRACRRPSTTCATATWT